MSLFYQVRPIVLLHFGLQTILGHDEPMLGHHDACTSTDDAAETLADLIGDTPAAVTIIVDGRVVYANAAAERLLGQPAGGLLNKEVMHFVHADDAAQVRRRLLLAGRAKPAAIAGSFETDLIGSDGAARRVESLVHSVSWAGAKAVGLISCDITARQERESHWPTPPPMIPSPGCPTGPCCWTAWNCRWLESAAAAMRSW